MTNQQKIRFDPTHEGQELNSLAHIMATQGSKPIPRSYDAVCEAVCKEHQAMGNPFDYDALGAC